MKVIQGGVCAAAGFMAGAVHSGIRKAKTKEDLALIVSSSPCQAAAVYTRNKVKADPLQVTKAHLGDHMARAIIANSGNANACAVNGHANAVRQCEAAARYLGMDVNDVLVAMEADSGIRLEALKADGGASANDFLMQTQADLIGAPVNRPRCVETTAMGAAYLAGLAVGYWSGPEEIKRNWAIDRTFEPSISGKEREKKLKGWKKAVKYAYGWAAEEEEE